MLNSIKRYLTINMKIFFFNEHRETKDRLKYNTNMEEI